MPKSTGCDLLPEEHAAMLAALRRARYGYVLALHIVLLFAAGRTPTDIAAVLFCSRSSVYRTVRAFWQGSLGWAHDDQGRLMPPVRTTDLLPTLRRSLLALLKGNPAGVWLVPHPLELCHACSDVAKQAADCDLRRDDAPLAARDRLGVETRQAGGERRRSTAGDPSGAHSLGVRAAQAG